MIDLSELLVIIGAAWSIIIQADINWRSVQCLCKHKIMLFQGNVSALALNIPHKPNPLLLLVAFSRKPSTWRHARDFRIPRLTTLYWQSWRRANILSRQHIMSSTLQRYFRILTQTKLSLISFFLTASSLPTVPWSLLKYKFVLSFRSDLHSLTQVFISCVFASMCGIFWKYLTQILCNNTGCTTIHRSWN